jgi:hypothetical protein
MVDRPPWPAVELTGARPSGRSEPWRRGGEKKEGATRLGKEGGCHEESILASTEAWKVERRRCTGSGASAWKDDGVGTMGTKRRRV